ncbi:metal ABC transporter permease, partial [Micromonospora fluostatini]
MIADDLVELLWQGLRETAYMVGVASLLAAVGGLLVGVALVLT